MGQYEEGLSDTMRISESTGSVSELKNAMKLYWITIKMQYTSICRKILAQLYLGSIISCSSPSFAVIPSRIITVLFLKMNLF